MNPEVKVVNKNRVGLGVPVWFIGWLDGLALPGLEGRRIAFACMLTHADPEDAAGGKTCAPFMRMLFERIDDDIHTARCMYESTEASVPIIWCFRVNGKCSRGKCAICTLTKENWNAG